MCGSGCGRCSGARRWHRDRSAVALLAARSVEPLLFATLARDPLVFASVAVILLCVSYAATLWPALRANAGRSPYHAAYRVTQREESCPTAWKCHRARWIC